MQKAKIILFGGSFDPIHIGHLRVAEVVVEKLQAGRLIFVPARRSPHKQDMPTPGRHRAEMIERAIAGWAMFSVSDCELHRHEPSYTLDTIHHFRRQLGADVDLFWLIGADQLGAFDRWYHVHELLDACRVAVMHRAGYPPPDFDRFRGVFSPGQIAQLQRDAVETPLIDISSTDIRRRLALGDRCEDVLPEAVIHYIRAHHLYGCGD